MIKNDIIISGNRAIARSYAKINLTLDVLGKREDGYHDVEMIMQTLSLFDLVIIDKTASGISISTNLKYLSNTEKNIAYQAAEAFYKATGIKSGVKIMIHKNIPVAAGLAGGSGNAAAVLLAMNMLYNTGLTIDELCGIGLTIGADVPFCIKGGTQLACGIGEILTPIETDISYNVLLVKPLLNISTAAIYKEIDGIKFSKRPNNAAMIKALNDGDIYGITENLCNVMENATEKAHPIISGIKSKMLADGALGTLMSGSGPTVFGIFDDYGKAFKAAEDFSFQFKDTYITKTYY